MIKTKYLVAATVALGLSSSTLAASFINGGFENGNFTGWTVSNAAYRSSVNNTNLTPSWITSNAGNTLHTSIVDTSYMDPNLGATLGSTVYDGNYAIRVEDTRSGGWGSVISQSVTNYTEQNIFFVWKAVFLGAHTDESAAVMKLVLRDDTTGEDLITRTYNGQSGGGGVDANFSTSGNWFYTPDWQTEQLALDTDRLGNDFTLYLIAADCSPTAHQGYVYLDGFGSVEGGGGDNGTGTVPEPATLAMLGLGLAGLAGFGRRKAA